MPILLLLIIAIVVTVLFLGAVGIAGIIHHHAWGPFVLGFAALLGILLVVGLAVAVFGARLYY